MRSKKVKLSKILFANSYTILENVNSNINIFLMKRQYWENLSIRYEI